MDVSPISALLATCALVAACESQPSVTFVTNGSDFNVLGLTDDQDTCEAPGRLLRGRRWGLAPSALATAQAYLQRGEISARGLDRVLRLAWSVADLAGHLRGESVLGEVHEEDLVEQGGQA